jgi:hypothetical protein
MIFLYILYIIVGWIGIGACIFVLQYLLFFRGVKNAIHCYIHCKRESNLKVAVTLLKAEDITIDQFINNERTIKLAPTVLFVCACILGPIKLLDFIVDVIYFTFRWESTNDKNPPKNS